jgi:hypothetical protein
MQRLQSPFFAFGLLSSNRNALSPHLICPSSSYFGLLLKKESCPLDRFVAALRTKLLAMAGVMRGCGPPIGQ